MNKSILAFVLSALLSVLTLYAKTEHSFDYMRVIPAGLYFIAAFLWAVKPEAAIKDKLTFISLALLLWLVLFSVSYNLLFFVIAPISGGVGAWLIMVLSKQFLGFDFTNKKQVILAGVIGPVVGVLLMIVTKKLPAETYTMELKAGMIVMLWQIGVGWQLVKGKTMLEQGNEAE